MYMEDKNGDHQEAGYIHKITILFNHPDQGKHSVSRSYPQEEKILIIDEQVLLEEFIGGEIDYRIDTSKGVVTVEYFDSKEDMWEFEEYLEDSKWYKKEYGEDSTPEPQTNYFFFDNTEPGKAMKELQEKYEEIKFRMDGLEK